MKKKKGNYPWLPVNWGDFYIILCVLFVFPVQVKSDGVALDDWDEQQLVSLLAQVIKKMSKENMELNVLQEFVRVTSFSFLKARMKSFPQLVTSRGEAFICGPKWANCLCNSKGHALREYMNGLAMTPREKCSSCSTQFVFYNNT